jgi:hypothetical protein
VHETARATSAGILHVFVAAAARQTVAVTTAGARVHYAQTAVSEHVTVTSGGDRAAVGRLVVALHVTVHTDATTTIKLDPGWILQPERGAVVLTGPGRIDHPDQGVYATSTSNGFATVRAAAPALSGQIAAGAAGGLAHAAAGELARAGA